MDRVELIPWDPENEEQYQRLHIQQISWGWFEPATALWKQQHLNGQRTFFWITLVGQDSEEEGLLKQHVAAFPAEAGVIVDTALRIAEIPRTPTRNPFIPIGHLGLKRIETSEAENLALPASTLRIVSLYVSWVLQGGGFGKGAVGHAERIAASPPFNAAATVLETITENFQNQESYLKQFYDDKGLKRPLQTNVVWYSRRGYEIIEGSEVEIKSQAADLEGTVELVQMRKLLK